MNTHPFQFGHWVFAHNGNIENFDSIRHKLLDYISDSFVPYILGSTDSELIFFIILSELEKEQDILSDTIQYQKLRDACHRSIEKIVNLVGKLYDDSDSPEKSFLTFLITNGDNMIGFNGGKDLFTQPIKQDAPKEIHAQVLPKIARHLQTTIELTI